MSSGEPYRTGSKENRGEIRGNLLFDGISGLANAIYPLYVGGRKTGETHSGFRTEGSQVSGRWTIDQLAEHLNTHPGALRRNPFIRQLIDAGIERGFIETAKVARPSHDYKAEFEQVLSYCGIEVETESRFAPPRRWRSDYRIRNTKILIEFEGGLFAKGKQGHSSVSGILRDIEKYNTAALLGFTVIRIAPNHIKSGQALLWVTEAVAMVEIAEEPEFEKTMSKLIMRATSDFRSVKAKEKTTKALASPI